MQFGEIPVSAVRFCPWPPFHFSNYSSQSETNVFGVTTWMSE
jgi:hypothetical protein